jgi:hypothetical protein
MDERGREAQERAKRALEHAEEAAAHAQLARNLRPAISGDATPEERATAAAELHAAHAEHEERSGDPERAAEARERERRARVRASRG